MASAYAFFRVACHGIVVGREHITLHRDRGFIVAANHASYLDWLVLAAFFHYVEPVPMLYLAKDRVFRHPLWKWIVSPKDCLRVSDDAESVQDPRDMANVRFLLIFPEGKRSPNGTIGRGHTGVIKYAVALGLPIIPVGLVGFFRAWPPSRKLPRPARCQIVFGAPLDLGLQRGAFLSDRELRFRTDDLMGTIAELCSAPR